MSAQVKQSSFVRKIVSACFLLIACLSITSGTAFADAKEADTEKPDTSVYFIAPRNGAVISGEVTVKFGLKGKGIAPAGVDFPNTGHHHLLINLETLPDMTKTLPANDNIKHFGGGQTETTLNLPPGKHTLQLLLGNYVHVPHDPPIMSEKITITVK